MRPSRFGCRSRWFLWLPIDAAVIAVGGAALVAFLARHSWAADMCCQFRVQWLIFLLPATLSYWLMRRGKIAWFALGCLIANAIPLLPYLTPVSDVAAVSGQTPTRIMMFNVLVTNARYAGVIDHVHTHDPDILVAIEADQSWTEGLRPIREAYPHRYLIDDRGTSSMAVYSKLPFDSIETHLSTKRRLPSIDMTVTMAGQPVRIFATHPYVPLTRETAKLRNEQMRDVAAAMDHDRSRILLGDFNCTPWSPHFGDVLQTANVTPAGYGRGLRPTWYRRSRWHRPLNESWLFALKLDHVLVSSDLKVTHYELGPWLGSDHRAVIVDVLLATLPAGRLDP